MRETIVPSAVTKYLTLNQLAPSLTLVNIKLRTNKVMNAKKEIVEVRK